MYEAAATAMETPLSLSSPLTRRNLRGSTGITQCWHCRSLTFRALHTRFSFVGSWMMLVMPRWYLPFLRWTGHYSKLSPLGPTFLYGPIVGAWVLFHVTSPDSNWERKIIFLYLILKRIVAIITTLLFYHTYSQNVN